MLLEIAPYVFHRIELRRIGGKPLQQDASAGALHVILHQAAAMNRGTIPDDGQLSLDMPLEVAKELNDLGPLDAAGVDLEKEPVQTQSANHRETLPTKGLLDHWRFADRCPRPHPGRPGAQSAFVDEDDGSAFCTGFFLSPAIPPVSNAGSWFHPVLWPGVPDADS